MRIAIDAMGTDRAPAIEVAGAVAALRELDSDIELLLVGDRERIEEELSKLDGFSSDRLGIVHAPDRILSDEAPVSAVRRKPESSIVVGLRLHKQGEVDAFVSAGSTGAIMASSLLQLRRLPGVARPAIGALLPTASDPVLMLDSGANVDCSPENLYQFAQLGNIYAQDIMGIPKPKVALLNIGEEREKGDELSVATHRLLAESSLNFIGNVEGRDIIAGGFDVLVCDGFVGNVLLKFYESVAEFIIGLLNRELESASDTLHLEEAFRALDYAEYGGAPLLGVNGVSIICHGGSPPKAIFNAIRVAAEAVRSGMVEHITGVLADDQPVVEAS